MKCDFVLLFYVSVVQQNQLVKIRENFSFASLNSPPHFLYSLKVHTARDKHTNNSSLLLFTLHTTACKQNDRALVPRITADTIVRSHTAASWILLDEFVVVVVGIGILACLLLARFTAWWPRPARSITLRYLAKSYSRRGL